MANAKKVGALIKNARMEAGFTQEQLAKKIRGVTASDISRAERGEKELTSEQLKLIAKATGITQKSLLDAAKPASAKKPAQSAAKPAPGAFTASMKVTATEKRLVELYRKADSQTKKNAMKLLRGSGAGEILTGDLLTGVIDAITGKRSLEDGEETEE